MALTMADKADVKNQKAPWPADITAEFERESKNPNPCVGGQLLSENQRSRVWMIRLAPGKRCGFHRHVLDYFWTCHTHGAARGYFEDGRIDDVKHFPGDTKHMTYGAGEYLLHSVENIGDTELLFTTVEFKQSANAPLPVPDEIRLQK